jgi:DNA-binding protein YbaB
MTAEMDPQVADALQQAIQFQSAMDEQVDRMHTGSFKGTDEAESVQATLNGHGLITGLYIEDGLLRRGAEVVGQRVNEALRNAQAAVTAACEAESEQLLASLADIANVLRERLS